MRGTGMNTTENSRSMCTDIIKNVPSLSSNQYRIVKSDNSLINENPDMQNTIFALITYSTQKWASDVRKIIRIDTKSEKILEEEESRILEQFRAIARQGIIPRRLDYDFKNKREQTDEILLYIEKAISELQNIPKYGKRMSEVIKAAHCMDGSFEDVSRAVFNKYYELAVMDIFHSYGDVLNELVSLMTPDVLYTGSVYGREYHNTELLIKIYPIACRQFLGHGDPEDIWSDIRLQKDSNGLYLLSVYTKAVEALATYPNGGERYHDIIRLMNEGKGSKEICEELNLSKYNFRRYRIEAINLLSFVLWGFSTAKILNNLVFEPVKDYSKILLK